MTPLEFANALCTVHAIAQQNTRERYAGCFVAFLRIKGLRSIQKSGGDVTIGLEMLQRIGGKQKQQVHDSPAFALGAVENVLMVSHSIPVCSMGECSVEIGDPDRFLVRVCEQIGPKAEHHLSDCLSWQRGYT